MSVEIIIFKPILTRLLKSFYCRFGDGCPRDKSTSSPSKVVKKNVVLGTEQLPNLQFSKRATVTIIMSKVRCCG